MRRLEKGLVIYLFLFFHDIISLFNHLIDFIILISEWFIIDFFFSTSWTGQKIILFLFQNVYNTY